MANRRVPGQRLHLVKRAFSRPTDLCPLDASVLIPERDLQVKNLFTMALEAEMPRFDDAGMYGTNSHLVDLLPLDTVEIRDANNRSLVRLPAPRIVARPIGRVEADWLQPGMALRTNAVLLGDFSLEQMDLGAVRRQRGEASSVTLPTRNCPWALSARTAYRST
jgi:hypothetical protein